MTAASTFRRGATASLVSLVTVLAAGTLSGQVDGDRGTASTASPAGRVTGTVISAYTGEPLAHAQVHLESTDIGTLSSVDGRYVLRNVPAGTYDLRVALVGYGTKTATGLQVPADDVVTLDISLNPEAIALEGITVVAAMERGTTAALLGERRRSGVVVDAIGRDQIARSPDGDAASALRRVPGVTVVDGRFAYVRGLGERYNSTTLNGAPLASPVPDQKVIPLDVIPTDLLESVVTVKSYSPDQPGDYAGGLVQLRTRNFPSRETYRVGVSSGWNSVSTHEPGLSYSGGAFDLLGFDDGVRNLPSVILLGVPLTRSNYSPQQLEQIGQAFGSVWGPTPREVPLDFGGNFSYGNEFELLDRSLGFLAAGNYSRNASARSDLVERVFSTAGLAEPEVDFGGQWTTYNVSLGGLLNLSYDLSPSHRIGIHGVYNRLVEDDARILEGLSAEENTRQRNTRIRFIAQEMVNGQVEGQHLFPGLGDLSVEWRGSYSRAQRYEPNTREVLYQEVDGVFLWENFIQSGSIFHQELIDDGMSGQLDVRLPFELRGLPASIQVGASTDRKDRETYTRRFRFLPRGAIPTDVRALSPNELFAWAHIAPDLFEIQEATFRTDNYVGAFDVDAAYVMLDAEVIPRLRMLAGARFERTREFVQPVDLFDEREPLAPADLHSDDVLPAINLTYELTDQMNLRGSVSRTLARPHLRELAPFSFADYAGGFLVLGNPVLDLTDVTNFDLRWEWYFERGGLLAVSGFYKEFDNPIEEAVLPTTELIRSWFNAESATNYGTEVELRSDLGFVDEALEPLSLNLNVTLVESEVVLGDRAVIFLPASGELPLQTTESNRPLQGQSPYVVNAGLTWAAESGFMATVLFNRFGERIDAVGGRGTPNIFEEARNTLDVVLEQELPAGLRAKLSASRLLGNEIEFTQGGERLRSWDMGRSVSLSLTWGSR